MAKLLDKILVIDYGMGNLRSVEKKFIKIGADVQISSNPEFNFAGNDTGMVEIPIDDRIENLMLKNMYIE